jgi:hypothetical protein
MHVLEHVLLQAQTFAVPLVSAPGRGLPPALVHVRPLVHPIALCYGPELGHAFAPGRHWR